MRRPAVRYLPAWRDAVWNANRKPLAVEFFNDADCVSTVRFGKAGPDLSGEPIPYLLIARLYRAQYVVLMEVRRFPQLIFAYGGGGGIRTHGALARTTVFETAPFDHSGTPPQRMVGRLVSGLACIAKEFVRSGICAVPEGGRAAGPCVRAALDGMVRNTSGPPFPDRPEPLRRGSGSLQRCEALRLDPVGYCVGDPAHRSDRVPDTVNSNGGSEVVGRMVRDAPACPAGMQRGSRGSVVNSRLTVRAPGL